MSRWVRTILPAALAATLSIKLLAAAWGATHLAADPWQALERGLRDAGFERDVALPESQPRLLSVSRGDCRLLIAQVSPRGWHRDLMERLTKPGETRHFVFRNVIGSEQDVLATSLSFYRMRLLRYAGINAAEEPVWGVISSAGCGEGDLSEAFLPRMQPG